MKRQKNYELKAIRGEHHQQSSRKDHPLNSRISEKVLLVGNNSVRVKKTRK